MGPFEVEIVGTIMGVTGVLVALGMFMRFSLRKKEIEYGRSGHSLEPEVDALREELHETKAQVAELAERIDFAERLLSRGDKSNS